MEIHFTNEKLKKRLSSEKETIKTYGKDIAKKLFARISSIQAALTLEDLLSVPGKLHSLEGNLNGCWAFSLTKNYRLLIRPYHPQHTAPQEIDEIVIIDIEDYH